MAAIRSETLAAPGTLSPGSTPQRPPATPMETTTAGEGESQVLINIGTEWLVSVFQSSCLKTILICSKPGGFLAGKLVIQRNVLIVFSHKIRHF